MPFDLWNDNQTQDYYKIGGLNCEPQIVNVPFYTITTYLYKLILQLVSTVSTETLATIEEYPVALGPTVNCISNLSIWESIFQLRRL